jgi:hypothetical protein
MRALIQPGKPFTAADMVDWLSAAQPGQSFNPLTVRAYLSRLGSAGEIRKLYQNGKNYARWISAASYEQAPDLERKQFRHLIADILKVAGKPLGVMEITVALRDGLPGGRYSDDGLAIACGGSRGTSLSGELMGGGP